MILKDFIPAVDVREYIQLYRIVHLVFNEGDSIPPKAYPPRPEQCIAFYPFDKETTIFERTGREVANLPVVLYGQMTEVTNRLIGKNFLVAQVIFYPGALFRLTGIPATELTNQYLDAGTVLNSRIHEVNEQLSESGDYQQMIEVLNHFVRKLISKEKKSILPIDHVCQKLLYAESKMSVDQIARQAFYSNRQLERKVKERTGVSPVLFKKIIAFDNAFRMKNSFVERDWLRIAIECGFHDYQHLAKVYKEFTGLSPSAFHRIEENAPERKWGLHEGFYKALQ